MEIYPKVGERVPQIYGPEIVTGTLKFVTDLKRPGMLCGMILRSPYPHARIVSIDLERARRMKGVVVVSARDAPNERFGPLVEEWEVLASDKVRFVGDEIAAVAAADANLAKEALEKVQVEYEELPPVFTPEEARSAGAPQLYENRPGNIASRFELRRGDTHEAFRRCALVHEATYTTPQVYQAYLEPNAALAEIGSKEELILWLPAQSASISRMVYAKALGLDPAMVRVIVPPYGGGFGGKLINKLPAIAGLLALKVKAPVMIIYDRQEDFVAMSPRVPMTISLKIGVDDRGIFTGKEVQVTGTNGARTGYSPAVLSTACHRIDSLYHFHNLTTLGLSIYTNTVPTGAFRGFGNAQMTFAVESSIDMIASEMGMDPAQLRLKNAVKPGDVTSHGWKITSCGLAECIRRATTAAGWQEKRSKRQRFRGIGLACCNHVSGNRTILTDFDGSSAQLIIDRYGKVTLYHAESDMGQGQNTIFAQMVTDILGLSMEQVRVRPVDTDTGLFGLGSFASRGTFLGGKAVMLSAQGARQQLFDVAAQLLEANPADLEAVTGQIRVRGSPDKSLSFLNVVRILSDRCGGAPISSLGHYVPPTELPDPVTKMGNISPAYPFACHVAEVEVDPGTGKVTVLNFVAAHDLGKAINPMAAEGQVEGGVAQGLGYGLTEELVMDNGRVVNPSFMDYKILAAPDTPAIRPILVESNDPDGPFGAKGLGEPTLVPVAAAITNAIYNALGVRINSLPITPEKIVEALKQRGDLHPETRGQPRPFQV